MIMLFFQALQIIEASTGSSTFKDLLALVRDVVGVDSSVLYDLAISILEECKQVTPNPDHDTVIHLVNRAQGLCLVPHLLRPNSLIRVGEVLCTKQSETSIFANNVVDVLNESVGRVDVRRVIGLCREGLELLPIDHPYRLAACSSVADALYTEFKQSGEREDLEEAISLKRDALKLQPTGHPNRSDSLNDLATSLKMRFKQSGEREDLDEAILLHRDALKLRLAGHPERSSSLHNLAASLTRRFHQSGEREDLDEAVSLNQDALELLAASHSNESFSLSNLAVSLRARFEQSGEREDLD